MKHGTAGGYYNNGCRCRPCTDAATASRRRWRANLTAVPPRVHGTNNGYTNYGCRCEPCSEAGRTYRRPRRTAGKT